MTNSPCNNIGGRNENRLLCLQWILFQELSSQRCILTKKRVFVLGGEEVIFITSMLGSGEKIPSRIRIRQAYEIGAGVLAVACPLCAKMLDDAVKDEGLNEKLRVKDFAEIINETLND